MADPQLEVLAEEECWRLLGAHHLGRLALVDAKGPAIVPVNYVLDREAPVFRTDPGDLERLRALPLYPWAPGDKARYVRVRPASVTGRRIRIPDDLPFTWWG